MNIREALTLAITRLALFCKRREADWRLCRAEFIRIVHEALEGIPKEKENQSSGAAEPKQQGSNAPDAVILSKTNHPPANGKQHRKRYKCIKEEIKSWVEIVGILGGLAGLYLLWRQYGEMAKTTKIALGQLQAMQGQFQAMTNQAAVMQGQLDEMRETRTEDERAWVGVADIQPEFLGGILRYFQVDYKNTGKTPAIKLQTEMGGTLDPDAIPKKEEMPNPPHNLGMLAPGASGLVTSMERPLPIQMGLDIIGGKYPCYVYGTIWYADISGTNHWTQFCVKIVGYGTSIGKGAEGANETIWMPIHNSCDDAEPNQTK